jgi:D-alanyl-D-alanine carboxypeptidase (penicillin-binding protein 5/6)
VTLLLAVVVLATARGTVASATEPAPPPPAAPSAIIIDRVTGRVLWGNGIHDRRPMASTTKIMTAIIAIQRSPDLSRWLTAPAGVAHISGIGLKPGQRITVRQALLGLMVKSAQDCGITLATGLAGSEPAFVRWMNAKARELGLADTHYDNSTGSRRDPNHHSSVSDLAKLGRYTMTNAIFRDIVRIHSVAVHWDGKYQRRVTSNNLLLFRDWADGIKCGYTPVAKYCLVGSGQPGLRPFITATLGAPSRDRDALDHVAMFDWASTLYSKVTVVTAGDVVATVPIAGGGEVQVAAKTTLTAVVRSAAPVRPTWTLPAQFSEPAADGTVVGRVVYRADGVLLGTVKLVVVTPAPPSPPPSVAASLAPANAGSPAPGAD